MNQPSKPRGFLAPLFPQVIALILITFSMSACDPVVTTTPIPAGHAQIHVEFENVSTKDWNELTAFVEELATEHSVILKGSDTSQDVGDRDSFHGFGNDGFVNQTYNPGHPVPSTETEAAMKAALEEFLQEEKIDHEDVKLELRFGPQVEIHE